MILYLDLKKGRPRRRQLSTTRLSISSSQLVLLLLLLLATIPSPYISGEQDTIDDNSDDGGGIDQPFEVEGMDSIESAADGTGTGSSVPPSRQVDPIQIGDILVEDTSFASEVDFNDLRIPVPAETTDSAFLMMVCTCIYVCVHVVW